MTSQETTTYLARGLRLQSLVCVALLALIPGQLLTSRVCGAEDAADPYDVLYDVIMTRYGKDGKSYGENETGPAIFMWSDFPFGDKSITRADDAAPSPYAATLREHGIKPDAAGLGKYLRQLHPNEGQRREVRRLIEQLGSDRFTDRESAMRRLTALPIPPTEALRIAAESGNAEVRFRARTILARVKPRRLVRVVLMHAVFKTIETDKVQGLTAELLRAVTLCDQRHLQLAVRAAVRAAARPDDASLLREATKDDDKEVVAAAIDGLGAALGKSATGDLRRLLEHKTEEISLAASRALADQGDRTSLARLVKLLSAAALDVRVGAVQTLRQVSHTRHDYLPYKEALARKEAIKRWAAWVEGEGRRAKLHFPLKGVRIELGRTLITIHEQNKVIELDASGKQVWEKTGLKYPFASTGLPNGHRLISCYKGEYVVEYDASGKEVWRTNLSKKPYSVRRLENGNTLVACVNSNEVLEIRPDGSTEWEITINGGPFDVRRLDSGRTLVALYGGGRVVEVDRAGKVHWEIKGLGHPMGAQRLENGNTLVVEPTEGRVSEWDRGGKIVWQYTDLKSLRSAERLSNGNTLIADDFGVREVDRQGNVMWQKQMTGVAHATRY